MRLVLTAGFDRSPHALALAELARREGHEVAGVLAVRTLGMRRALALARRRGWGAVRAGARRARGTGEEHADRAARAALQRLGVGEARLSRWCRVHGARFRSVADLNGARALRLLRALAPEAVLYAGGGILREGFLDAAGGRVLNAHAGPLPDVRGMNACEWSLLLGLEPVVSIHRIDGGIDTGPLVARVPVPLEHGDTLAELRGRCTVLGIEALARAAAAAPRPAPALPQRAPSRQCFVLAPVLRELAERELARRTRARGRAP